MIGAAGEGAREVTGERLGEWRPWPTLKIESASSPAPETEDLDEREPAEERFLRIAGIM